MPIRPRSSGKTRNPLNLGPTTDEQFLALDAREGGHQKLFYQLCRELKEACRRNDDGFKASVSVKTLLDLECRYATAETAMMDRSRERPKAGTDV